MTSTNRTIVTKRVGQGLAATALIAGLAIGAAATAGAKPYNRDAYYRCINNGGYIDECCIMADGEVVYDPGGPSLDLLGAVEGSRKRATGAGTDHDPAGTAEPADTAVEPFDPGAPRAQQRNPGTVIR
jgi:hypothetical protein